MAIFSGITRLLLPSRVADGTSQTTRLSSYGEMLVIPIGAGIYPVAAEGGYFRATNPTFGTAFAPAVAAATAFSETQASIIVRNTAGAGGKDIYLDYIRIQYVTAPTANTALNAVMAIDNSNRTGSGGAGATIINTNSGVANTTIASVTVGAITAGAAVASRKLVGGPLVLKAAIPAINDIYLFNFGTIDTVQPAPGSTAAWACGPVYLPANSNHSFLFSLFGASQSAAGTVHMDMGWFER